VRGYRRVLGNLGANIGDSEYQFMRWFDVIGVQRHIKVLGIFARLWHRDGKIGYLADLPLVLSYVLDACQRYPELVEFGRWLEWRVAAELPLANARQKEKPARRKPSARRKPKAKSRPKLKSRPKPKSRVKPKSRKKAASRKRVKLKTRRGRRGSSARRERFSSRRRAGSRGKSRGPQRPGARSGQDSKDGTNEGDGAGRGPR
jgi:hypothetical protein